MKCSICANYHKTFYQFIDCFIKDQSKQAEYNLSISQNPYEPSRGVYFKGKLDILKKLKKLNDDHDTNALSWQKDLS